jgi:tetratricopeptide (TPR) repeat protein
LQLTRLGFLAAAAFLATLAALALAGGHTAAPPLPASGAAVARHRTTDDQIAALQRALLVVPRRSDLWAGLAEAELQKVRETGDPSYYPRAAAALARGQALAPANAEVLTALGTLALARHDFRSALRDGLAAHRGAPFIVRSLGVLVDANVELGRYRAAGAVLQRMVDAEPNLAAYARVSYYRELHGDLSGALDAMRLAVSAGGQAPENVAYVQNLLGNLQFDLGHLGAARRAYRQALVSFPNFVPATAGLARLDAVHGRYGRAIRAYRGAVARLPLPEYVVALGETELAAGHARRARIDLQLVRAEERLLNANGVNTDVDLALFEANHGSPARAVVLGRRAWTEAPSVRSADAFGWAITSAGHASVGLSWAQRALRLGSRDPSFLYHAGMSARAAGRRALARLYLGRALQRNPRFSVLYAPRARRALAGL